MTNYLGQVSFVSRVTIGCNVNVRLLSRMCTIPKNTN